MYNLDARQDNLNVWDIVFFFYEGFLVFEGEYSFPMFLKPAMNLRDRRCWASGKLLINFSTN